MLRHIGCGGPIKTICGLTHRLFHRRTRSLAVLLVIALLLASLPGAGRTRAAIDHTAAIRQPLFTSELYYDLSTTLASVGTWLASYRSKSAVASTPYEPFAAYIAPPLLTIHAHTNPTGAAGSSSGISLSWTAAFPEIRS